MEQGYQPKQGKENHVIAVFVDEKHIVTTLERIEASYGDGYIVLDVPMTGESEGERFIRGFSYAPEIAQGTFYRCTGMTVTLEAITG